MKTPLLLWAALCLGCLTIQAQNVNIPDANFKAALVANTFVNTNGDSEIQLNEARNALWIRANNANISDLTGIEEFVNITSLNCYGNNLTTVDLSNNPKLIEIRVENNQITNLVLPANNTKLEYLYCQNNRLTVLNLPNDIDTLKQLYCQGNQLTSLSLTGAMRLENLNCSYNNINQLILPTSGVLTNIYCQHNNLSALSTSYTPYQLDCGNNPMDSLTIGGPFAGGAIQHTVHCDSSQLVYLDLSLEVDTIHAQHNNLTAINILPSSKLSYMNFSYNAITEVLIGHSDVGYVDLSHNDINVLRFYGFINNINNTIFDARNNSRLWCIALANSNDINYARANWTNTDNAVTYGTRAICNPIWLDTRILPSLEDAFLYPNPTTGNVHVQLENIHHNLVVEVYNSVGQIVGKHRGQSTDQLEIELPSTSGWYFCVLKTRANQRTFTVVKK